MAVTDVSPKIAQFPAKRRIGADAYVLIVGLAAVASLGIARFIYEPSYQEKEQVARAGLAAEHAKVCEQLGKAAGTWDRDSCLKLLDSLYTTHKGTILADSGEI